MGEIGGGCGAANVHHVHSTAGFGVVKTDLRSLFDVLACRAAVVTHTNYNGSGHIDLTQGRTCYQLLSTVLLLFLPLFCFGTPW